MKENTELTVEEVEAIQNYISSTIVQNSYINNPYFQDENIDYHE